MHPSTAVSWTRSAALTVVAAAALLGAACAPPPGGNTATIDVGGQTVTVTGPADSTVSVAPADLGSLPPLPSGLEFPIGALGITVDGITVGSVATVVVTLQQPVDGVLKLMGGTWDPFDPDGTTGASVSGDGLTIQLLLQDGGRGDTDGVADGRIVDPLGAFVEPQLEWFPTGCYDSPNANIADLRYQGPANALGNFAAYQSTNGTCSSNVVPVNGAIVRGDASADALPVCQGLGRTQVLNLVTFYGYTDVPADSWLCV